MKVCEKFRNIRNTKAQLPLLKQEEAGIHVGISRDLETAALHSARVMQTQYRNWECRDRYAAWGRYKQRYFTIAVGGGNTVKAIYRAWLDEHHGDVDWIAHVRFFLLEDSTGEPGWESA